MLQTKKEKRIKLYYTSINYKIIHICGVEKFMKDSKKRSIAKSISFRIISIIVLAIITYLITGNIVEMTYIVIVFQTIQTFAYYFHERLWEKTMWGK